MRILSLVPYISFVLGIILTCATVSAQDDSYPVKQVRFIVPFAAGGASDAVTRILASKLSEMWKVGVVVDNRGGGGGNIGVEAGARAAPDGYTLLTSTVGTHGINPSLFRKLPYDPVKDFEPISLVATTVSVLSVNPALPVKTIQEFIAYAKANPEKLNFGSSGNGSSHHLAGVMFNSLANVKTRHVPYKGTAAMMTDLVGGQIEFTFDPVPSSLQQIKAGKLRALAVTSLERVNTFPELPTMHESGVTGYDVGSWYGILAPAGTSKAIVNKISADIAAALRSPDVKAKLEQQGAIAIGSTPEQLGTFIKKEMVKWAPVVKSSGATID